MNKINHSSKNKNRKNRKIDFLFVSEYRETIWTQKWKRLHLRKGGGGSICISLTRTGRPHLATLTSDIILWSDGLLCNQNWPKLHWAKLTNVNNTFERVIGILVNWHISPGILTRLARAILVKIPVLKCDNLQGSQWLVQRCRLCCTFLSVHSLLDRKNWGNFKSCFLFFLASLYRVHYPI